jgi:hypothetical protein
MATTSDTLVQDSWICSALIVAALFVAGIIKDVPSTVRLTTPRDVVQMLAAIITIGTPNIPASVVTGTGTLSPFFDPYNI